LLLGFDTFGYGAQTESLGEADDGADQRNPLGRCNRVSTDERPIDLQNVRWQLLEIVDRCVAGSEVINGDPQTKSTQLMQSLHGCGIVQQYAFRHFQHQQIGVKPGLEQYVLDMSHKGWIVKLPG
jgi:hypothetical protein